MKYGTEVKPEKVVETYLDGSVICKGLQVFGIENYYYGKEAGKYGVEMCISWKIINIVTAEQRESFTALTKEL